MIQRDPPDTPGYHLVQRLGGCRAVSEAIGWKRAAVGHWYHTGVPPKAFGPLLRLASNLGIDLTLDDLELIREQTRAIHAAAKARKAAPKHRRQRADEQPSP